MHCRNRCHASKEYPFCDPISFMDHKLHDPLDFTNSVCQEWEKLVSHHFNLIHSMLHGSCRSEEPCTLITYFYTVQHTMNQVWRQGASDGIKKSSTKWRKVQHACAWQFVFQVRLNKNLQLPLGAAVAVVRMRTCIFPARRRRYLPTPEGAGRWTYPPSTTYITKSALLNTINCNSKSALLVAVLHVCSTLYSVQNFICTTSSLHVIVHR